MSDKTVEQLREQLHAAELELQERDRAQRAQQTAAWNRIMANPYSWEWQVFPTTYKAWAEPKERDGVKVQRRIRPELLREFKKGGFTTFASDYMEEGRWFGMFYFRTEENILYHDGGGHCVLKDVKLCSDEEWARLVRGDIPEKFRL